MGLWYDVRMLTGSARVGAKAHDPRIRIAALTAAAVGFRSL